jgi:hypothetical protein
MLHRFQHLTFCSNGTTPRPAKATNVGTGSRAPRNKNSCLVLNVLKVKNREIVMVGIEELKPIARGYEADPID